MVSERSFVVKVFSGDIICYRPDSSRLLRVLRSSQVSPLFQSWFSFSSTDDFQSFSICLRDQHILQFLIHLSCHIEFMLKVCDRDRLCFWLSATIIACFSVACTTPTKSLYKKYDQVLQLGPFFFPIRFQFGPIARETSCRFDCGRFIS